MGVGKEKDKDQCPSSLTWVVLSKTLFWSYSLSSEVGLESLLVATRPECLLVRPLGEPLLALTQWVTFEFEPILY